MNEHDRLAIWLVPVAAFVAPAYAEDYLTVEEAQRVLFPDARAFVAAPVTLTADQRARIRELAGVRQRWETQQVWRAEAVDGSLAGWFIVDEVIGKHEFITYAVGLSPDGRVTGVEILSYRETHGGQVREADWRARFVGKSLADSFKLNDDIPNITGATLSCRNVTDGVKRLLALQQVALPHG